MFPPYSGQRPNPADSCFGVFPNVALTWTACLNLTPTPLQCATLQVPIDYANPAVNLTRIGLMQLNPTNRPATRRDHRVFTWRSREEIKLTPRTLVAVLSHITREIVMSLTSSSFSSRPRRVPPEFLPLTISAFCHHLRQLIWILPPAPCTKAGTESPAPDEQEDRARKHS
jgi:hypothetical protein